ncbi:MAG: hypothetical protein ABI469_05695 [Gemmatimonadales bacterium]
MKSVDALLTALVDYAGLFPPASEDMRPALEAYASYVEGPERAALGRFIVPLSRLDELEAVGSDLMPREPQAEPWHLSALVTGDVRAAVEKLSLFNGRHTATRAANGHVVVDVVEMKATTPDEIAAQCRDLPKSFTPYFEIPITGAVAGLVKAIAKAGARAKVRTGGTTPDAFPPAKAVVDFIATCHREGVPFKATAGLHHPIRGEYRLTYEPGGPKGMMYGFLNVFIAATLLHAGAGKDAAIAALEESDASAFIFEEDALVWRGKRISAEEIAASRSELAISFGSCSFREPVDELEQLTGTTRANKQ